MATNTEMLQQILANQARDTAKLDKLQKSVDAISAAGTSPKDAVKAALKEIVGG